jgi:hypothetical protein
VGTCRVLPNLTKLTAVVDWKRPATALNLMSFLGLTGHFQDLIKGYAKVEGPLRDLVTKVKLLQPCTKSTYRHILRNHKLNSTWDAQHTKAFLDLKIAVTLEPILQGPQWDSTPFIMTTDGCQEGFARVLAQ